MEAKIFTKDGRRFSAEEININIIDRYIKARGSGRHFFIPFENLSFIVTIDREMLELKKAHNGRKRQ